MRLHRFIIDANLAPGPLTVRDPGLRSQLVNVLRLAVGDTITLCDGRGREAGAAILGFDAGSVEFDVGAVETNAAEPPARVTLYCAVLKRENFELVVQKATEAGAARIVPVLTRRTIKTGLRLDRLAAIAKEAVEQSGRGVLPVIAAPMTFKEALADAGANGANVMFELGGGAFGAAGGAAAKSGIGVWIGPEGGWDDAETKACEERGFTIASLGPRTLRAETAAIVATFLAARSHEAPSGR